MEAGLLLCVGAVLIFFTIRGWWRGFLRTALGMAALALALVLAVVFSPTVTELLRNHTPLYDTVREAAEEALGSSLEAAEEGSREEQAEALENSSLPGVLKEALLEHNNQDMYQLLGADSFLATSADIWQG